MIIVNNIAYANLAAGVGSITGRISSADEVMVFNVDCDVTALPTLTFNGNTVAPVVSSSDATLLVSVGLFIYWNPPVGDYTVTATSVGGGTINILAMSLLGVSKRSSNPIHGSQNTTSATPLISLQIASANSIIIDAYTNSGENALITPNGGQSQITRYNDANQNQHLASYKYAQPGVQTIGWTDLNSDEFVYVAMALEPDDAPSIWYPNVTLRNITDSANTLSSGITPAVFSTGYFPTEFYQNSFLHTVGRIFHISTGGVNNASVTQVHATLTFTGGTQVAASVQDVAVAQVGATITFTGGTQAVATVQDVAIAQVGASITFTGGTQSVSAQPIFESAAAENEYQTSQIIIDKVYQATSSSGTPLTIDVSIPSSDAVLVVTGGSVVSTGSNWQKVTYNGDLGASLVDQVTAGVDAEIWYFPNPPVGVSQLVVTPAATFGEAYVNAMVILGVDKKSVNLQTIAASNVGTTVSATLAPDAPNSLMLSVLAALDTLGEPVPLQNQNQIFAPAGINTNEYVEVAYQLTSSSQTISYSLGTLSNASLVAVTFRPANAASIWYPNIDQRQLDTVVDANALDQAVTPIPGTYGYNQSLFYQNSFLHTVGREFLGYKHVVVAVAQVAASVTFTGGTQAAATIQDVSIAQVGATITFTGGTQAIATVNYVSITQAAATLTFTGGTQVSETNAAIAQVGASITFTGGTQAVTAQQDIAIAQLGATVTFTGGTQGVVAGLNSLISQVGANLTFSGGTQSVSAIQIIPLLKILNLVVIIPVPVVINLSVPVALAFGLTIPAGIPLSLSVPAAIPFTLPVPTSVMTMFATTSAIDLELVVPEPIDMVVF